ncbi:MAG: T9SS type A sorting domain-containing protein [Ignavibacteriales bacterium]|nr:T9SS type A sorting domain-containing protein [Ignavibacteriales bacterium]
MNTLLSKSRLFFAAFVLFSVASFAQTTTFRVIMDSLPHNALQSTYFATASNNTNQTLISGARRVVFSVYLKNTSGATLELSGGQVYFNFNKAVLNNAAAVLNIVASGFPGTAPGTGMWLKNPTVTTTTTPGQLRTAASTLPGAGSGYQLAAGDSVLWGQFKLVTPTADMASAPFDLQVRVASHSNPYTKYGYYNVSGVGTAIENFGVYTNIDADTFLPVELAAFSAASKGRDIRLDWKTATEVGSASFEIERAIVKENSPAREWAKVASIPAKGNSNAPVDYSYTDKKLNAGTYAYRLKMIDNDGRTEYSKIEAKGVIDIPAVFALSQNYPNPFNPSTKIDYQLPQDAQVTLELYSISGEKISTLINSQSQEAGFHTYAFSAQSVNRSLASGLYIYRLIAAGKDVEKFVSVKKMVLMK